MFERSLLGALVLASISVILLSACKKDEWASPPPTMPSQPKTYIRSNINGVLAEAQYFDTLNDRYSNAFIASENRIQLFKRNIEYSVQYMIYLENINPDSLSYPVVLRHSNRNNAKQIELTFYNGNPDRNIGSFYNDRLDTASFEITLTSWTNDTLLATFQGQLIQQANPDSVINVTGGEIKLKVHRLP